MHKRWLIGLAVLLAGCGGDEASGDWKACELFFQLADDYNDGNVTFDNMLNRVEPIAEAADRGSDVSMSSAVLVNATRRGDDPAAADAVAAVNKACNDL